MKITASVGFMAEDRFSVVGNAQNVTAAARLGMRPSVAILASFPISIDAIMRG